MTYRGITPQQELFMAILLIGIAMAVISQSPPEEKDSRAPIPIAKEVLPIPPPPAQEKEKFPQIQPISGERAFFGPLSAEIMDKSALENRLLEVALEIEAKGKEGGFDGVEVVGHADTTPLIWPKLGVTGVDTTRTFNFRADLDTLMAAWLRGEDAVQLSTKQLEWSAPVAVPSASEWSQGLIPSNVDLAMLRALAVVKLLREKREDPNWPSLSFIKEFLPVSAGAFITPEGRLDLHLAPQDELEASRRRRIEFHLFKTSDRHR